ncbi:MAG: sulfite exporter TauE/SafE family protein [Peptococcaceae bacterium]|nr:sulfite exporter TauE/SafE family protein [Peptococcaceae bacterium]
MYMPISGETISVLPLIMIGFFVGVIGGFFGIGGAFMVTPALNIFGFPMAYAVGTDMAHMIGKSIVSTFRHWRFGHVDVMLALLMIAGTGFGVEAGARAVMWLTARGLADPVIRCAYIVILLALAAYMLWQYHDAARVSMVEHREVKDLVGNRLTRRLQSLKLPPVIELKKSGIRISLWIILLVGLLTGFLAGFLGVGGGFIRVPALMYVVGLPMKLAVGTDLFGVIFSGTYGGFTYALKGVVEIYGAIFMVIGAAAGAQFGTVATRYVFGIKMRLYFAVCVFGSALGVVAKQLSYCQEQAYLKAMKAHLAAQGMDAGRIAGILEDRAQVQALLAANPAWQQLADYEKFWNALGGVMMLGLAAGLSAIIISLCIRGIIVEKKRGVVLGA